jgi:hypothetical protein
MKWEEDMSAIPPEADMSGRPRVSVKCHEQTLPLFDDLVGATEQCHWYRDP